jgi:hypothetical protein
MSTRRQPRLRRILTTCDSVSSSLFGGVISTCDQIVVKAQRANQESLLPWLCKQRLGR